MNIKNISKKRALLMIAVTVVFLATALFAIFELRAKKQYAFAKLDGAEIYDSSYYHITTTSTVYNSKVKVNAHSYIDSNAFINGLLKPKGDPYQYICGPYKDIAAYTTALNYCNNESTVAISGKEAFDGKVGTYTKFTASEYGDKIRTDDRYGSYTLGDDETGYYFGIMVDYYTVDYSQFIAQGYIKDHTYDIYNIVCVTEPIYIKGPNDVANEWLTSATESKAKAAIKQLGYDVKYGKGVDDETNCHIKYFRMDGEFTYDIVVDTKRVPFWRTFNEEYMEGYVLESWYDNALSTFDAKHIKTVKALTDVGEINGLMEERVLREAIGFKYEHGAEATLTVEYTEFRPKDIYMRVLNNDEEFPNLKIDVYTSDIVRKNGKCIITFDSNRISAQLANKLNWITDISSGEITITGKQDTVAVNEVIKTDANGNEYVSVEIEVDEANVNDLFGLGLTYVAQIMPNYKMNLTYNYLSIDDNLKEVRENSESIETDLITVINLGTLEGTKSYEKIHKQLVKAISPESLRGAEYCVLNGVQLYKKYPATEEGVGTAVITCAYRYNTLLKTQNTLTGYVNYKKISELNKSEFKGAELDFGEIPAGYRIESIEVDGDGANIEFEDKKNYRNTVVSVLGNLNEKRIINVTANLSDKWEINIEYLTKHKDTPFAEKKTFKGEIKVIDYEEKDLPGVLKKLSAEELAKIIGVPSMNVLKSTVEDIQQEFNSETETYKVVPKYTFSSLKQLSYDGTTTEVKVPLTSYLGWASDYGKDWSILFLNTSETQWFKYSNDVDIENLYGYFAVAVFKEQVSDFNHWLAGTTGDGCIVLSEEMKVEGSKFYKISQKVQENSLFVAAAGAVVGGCIGGAKGAVIGGTTGLALPSVVMSACEIANDNNAMYYSYWFYLDGSSDLAFMAKNNAKNAEDTDGATKNKVDEAVSKIGNWIKENWGEFKESQTYDIVKWVLIVGVCTVLGLFFLKVIIAILKK